MGARLDLSSGEERKHFCRKEVHWGNVGHSFGFRKKNWQQVTLIAHNSGNGLPLALAGWALSINRDEKLRIHMTDEHIMSNFSVSNSSIISRSVKRISVTELEIPGALKVKRVITTVKGS